VLRSESRRQRCRKGVRLSVQAQNRLVGKGVRASWGYGGRSTGGLPGPHHQVSALTSRPGLAVSPPSHTVQEHTEILPAIVVKFTSNQR
jgi:hypothetical protein